MLISPRFGAAIPVAFFAARLAVFRVKAIAVAGLLLILVTGSFSQSALAQDTRVIPPPPRSSGATASETDPERAFSPTTGQNLYWDCNKKTWIDSKTGEPIPGGFEGRRGSDGEVIPPPPMSSGATASETDPERAFSPTTGQNLHWDRGQKSWIDSKTGKPVGIKGRYVKRDCPPPAKPVTASPPPVSVLLESVQPRSGNNPFNPTDPLGGSIPVSPLPPPIGGCQAPKPQDAIRTRDCPAGQTGRIMEAAPYICTPPNWTVGSSWYLVNSTCTTPIPQTGCSTIFPHIGHFACGGGCSVSGFDASFTPGSSSMQLSGFGSNPTAPFSCNGTTATSSGTFTLFGVGGHSCQFNAAGASVALSCSRPGASCSDSCQ